MASPEETDAREKAVRFLQSVAIQAVEAQDLIRKGLYFPAESNLTDIENDIAKVRDFIAPYDDQEG